jgi:class 3 adenylate cyclase/pSer/pThr/pTyr-binding forkhead associated (FHA) protein
MAYQFQIIPSVGKRSIFTVEKPLIKIGRTPHCDLVINDPLVSREHALLQVKAGEITLEDLNSANGTLVNDQRITRIVLRPGDKIRLGLSEMVLEALPDQEDASAAGTSAVGTGKKGEPLPVQETPSAIPPQTNTTPSEPAPGPRKPGPEQDSVREVQPPAPSATEPPVPRGGTVQSVPEETPASAPEPLVPSIPLVSPNQDPPVILVIHPGCPKMKRQLEPLAAAGVKIKEAADRDQVRAALQGSHPDCILLCHRMAAPLELYQELRSQFPNIPLALLLHGEPWAETLSLIRSGVDEVLHHQDFTEFQVRVRSLVKMNRLRQETVLVTSQVEKRVSDDVSEAERINRLKRYLSPQLVAAVLSGEESHVLKPTRQEVTIVFSDLRNYTQFSEVSEPEEIISMLKDFHALYGEIIFRYDGTLERFAGDGVMVFFGAPVPFADHARRAVAMAVEARERLVGLKTKWEKLGYSLDISFGISTGYVYVGNIGFEGRMDYAAIGKTTNLAARLCAAAKGGQILISRKTLFQVEDLVEVEEIGALEVKGFSHPVAAHNILQLKGPYTPRPVN